MSKGSVLITGANGTLGTAFAFKFLQPPYALEYHGLFAVRNPTSAHDLIAVTKTAQPQQTYENIQLDLGSLESIRATASEINKRVASGSLPPIRALILNAAFQDCNTETSKPQSFTKDGFETAFAVNYLANFLLVLLLLQSLDKEHGRIVLVSSTTHDPDDKRNGGHYVTEKIMFHDTETLAKGVTYTDCKSYDAGVRRYGASKLLLVMFMYELQRRLDTDPSLSGISVLCVDPGAMGGTSITRRSPLFIRFLAGVLLVALRDILVYFWPNGTVRSPAKSASDLLLASFEEEKLGKHPKALYLDGSLKAESSVESHDVQKQKQLWIGSLELAGIKDGDTELRDWK